MGRLWTPGAKPTLQLSQYREDGQVRSKPCRWFSVADLISAFRRCEMDDLDYWNEFYAGLDGAHIFIDDIDKFKRSDFRDQAMFDLFDRAYRSQQKLTITSNLSLADLVKNDALDASVVRRIDDSCTALEGVRGESKC